MLELRLPNSLNIYLRPPVLEDAEWMFPLIFTDRRVFRYMPWKAHSYPHQTLSYIKDAIQKSISGTGELYVVILADSCEGGGIIRHSFIEESTAAIALILSYGLWGKGIPVPLLKYYFKYLLEDKGISTIQGICHTQNRNSEFVMQKSGMVYQGILKKFMIFPNISQDKADCHLYALGSEKKYPFRGRDVCSANHPLSGIAQSDQISEQMV
jgi:ribosomal-protein-alanine N-acetyltransferase